MEGADVKVAESPNSNVPEEEVCKSQSADGSRLCLSQLCVSLGKPWLRRAEYASRPAVRRHNREMGKDQSTGDGLAGQPH